MQQGLRTQDVCLIEDDLEKQKFDMRLLPEQLRHRTTLDAGKTCRTSDERTGKITSLKESPESKDEKNRKGRFISLLFFYMKKCFYFG